MVGWYIGGALLIVLAILIGILIVWFRAKTKSTYGEAALRSTKLIVFTVVFSIFAVGSFAGGAIMIIKGITGT